MDNATLKELINRNKRPGMYKEGDRVVFRRPESDENNDSFSSFTEYLGKTGTITKGSQNNRGGVVYVKFDDKTGSPTTVRAHWVELL